MRRPPERSGSSAKKPTNNKVISLPERRAEKQARQPKPAKAASTRRGSALGRGAKTRTPLGAKGRGEAARNAKAQLREARQTVKRFTSASRGRKAVVVTLLSSFAVLILVVIATLTTPLLAVQQLRVTGLKSISEKQVTKALKDQIGVPLALVSQQHVVDALASFNRIESVSLVAELPHTLRVAITERSPIAIVVVAGVAYLYDPAGIRLDVAHSSDMYPVINSSGEPSTSASFKEAIAVLLALPQSLLSKVASVNATSQDNVTLQLRGYSGQRIIWGDSSEGILKSRVLSALMANQKPTDRVTYDVSSPRAPVVRWR